MVYDCVMRKSTVYYLGVLVFEAPWAAFLQLWDKPMIAWISFGVACGIGIAGIYEWIYSRGADFADEWLLGALQYVIHGSWDRPIAIIGENANNNKLHATLDEIRQFAADGRLDVWGKEGSWQTAIWRKIPKDFWLSNAIDAFDVFRGSAENLKTSQTIGNSGLVFRALKINKRQVYELWPGDGIYLWKKPGKPGK